MTCQGRKRDGSRCSRLVKPNQKYCWQHQPKFRFWIRNLTLGGIILAVLSLIGLLADLSGLGILPQIHKPERMSGDFRIAVADFEQNGNDDIRIGEEIGQGAYLRLVSVFEEIKPSFTVTIWGPKQVGKVEGQTANERAISAGELADRIGADLIIFGTVETTESIWYVMPEFYVSSSNFYEAVEISGLHALGAPIQIAGQGNVADRIESNDTMAVRIQVLSQIVIGLAYYANRAFDDAIKNFELVKNIREWEDNEGQQVLYLLLGNAAVKNNYLELAAEYYNKSISIDTEYARGYLGVANLYYRQALKPFEASGNASDVDTNLLDLALNTLDKAAAASNQSPQANIPTKIHFELGQIYFVQAYIGKLASYEFALREFETVINDYGNGANPQVQERAAESHARIALIYSLSDNSEQAKEEYLIAASLLAFNPERQQLYEKRAYDHEISNLSEIE